MKWFSYFSRQRCTALPLIALAFGALLLSSCGGGCGSYNYRYYVVTNVYIGEYCDYYSSGCSPANFRITFSTTSQGVEHIIAGADGRPTAPRVLAAGSPPCDYYDYNYQPQPVLWVDSIRITSDRSWNDTLPAGTNLANIFQLATAEFYHGTRQDTVARQGVREVYTDILPLVRQGLYMPHRMELRLLTAPVVEYYHNLSVYIRMSDGREYSQLLDPVSFTP
jgi:hypothetical protein